MTPFVNYSDWFDSKTAEKTCEFYLYRNYYIKHDNGKYELQYSPKHPYIIGSPELALTLPVAKGITVFYHEGDQAIPSLYEILYKGPESDLSSITYYENYFDKAYKYFIKQQDRSPFQITKDEAELIFLQKHLQAETKHLPESEKYYSEFLNESDANVKTEIKQYAEGYVKWIEKKLKAIQPESQFNNNVPASTEKTYYSSIRNDSVFSILDQYNTFQYIGLIDKLLHFINDQFKLQKKLIQINNNAVSGSPDTPIIENQYYLEINLDLFNDVYFKRRCQEMYTSSHIKLDKLKDLLSRTYFLAADAYSRYIFDIEKTEFNFITYNSFHHDQLTGNLLKGYNVSETYIFTNKDFSLFCDKIIWAIQGIIFQNEEVLRPGTPKKKDVEPVQSIDNTIKDQENILNINNSDEVYNINLSSTSENEIYIEDPPLVQSEAEVDPVKFLSIILDPLINESFIYGKNKRKVICINSDFKKHLKKCFLALINNEELPIVPDRYKIYFNRPFYDAIIRIQRKFNIKTGNIIEIIISSTYRIRKKSGKGPEKSIRHELVSANKRLVSTSS